MDLALWGFTDGLALSLPQRPSGLLVLVLEIVLLGLLWAAARPTWMLQRSAHSRRRWIRLGLLAAAAPLAAGLLLVRLRPSEALLMPGSVQAGPAAAFSLAGALPWMLAAGWFGPAEAALIGLLGGLARGGGETFRILTPLHWALAAGLFAWLVRRDYSGWLGQAARQPWAAALAAGLALALGSCFEVYAHAGGSAYDAVGVALASAGRLTSAAVLETGLAGLACTLLRRRFPADWFSPRRLRAAPYSRSLAARLLLVFFGLGALGAAAVMYGDWLLARAASLDLLEGQMRRAALQAGRGVPYFTQSGRALLAQTADELTGRIAAGGVVTGDLERALRGVAFFRRLALFDPEGALLGQAGDQMPDPPIALELEAALRTAAEGLPQEAVLLPAGAGGPASVAFVWPVYEPGGESPRALLVGWSDLDANPLLAPIAAQLAATDPGVGFLIDGGGRVLLHPDGSQVGQVFTPPADAAGRLTTDRAPDGTARLVYLEPIPGHPWQVVITVPEREAEALALPIALRLGAVVIGVGVLLLAAVYVTSRRLTEPLRAMAASAEAMARGSLDQRVEAQGEDEIGRLAASFERMRRSLKSRLEEMDLLLLAGQQVASSFDLRRVLPPILEGVQSVSGADVVRLVLAPDGLAPGAPPEAYAAGQDEGGWEPVDVQVVELCRRRERFVLENPARARAVLDLRPVAGPVEALMALPLRNEEQFVGALWLAHRQPHAFSGDEVNLLTILAGQLGVSVANARFYTQAEQQRARLAAVLAATPEAVIVTDRAGRISLVNPAAESLLRGAPAEALGEPAAGWLIVPEVVQLLAGAAGPSRSAEVTVGSRVLFATVSEVEPPGEAGGGRVCVLSDITHYKRVDALKSEFVATVSHDLRAPLTLMRGYATMLSMVGELSEKQGEFAGKILAGVDQMTRLVDNLLDLGRIEAGVGLSLEPVRAETIVRDVVHTLRPQALGKHVTLEIELQEGREAVEADATLLRQAVSNLVDNAIRYTQPGGRVVVRAGQSGGRQQIAVQDSGPGIAPADQARLFEKFYRTRRREALREKGSGLGLAIVKSILDQHGGEVRVESRLGAGSTFTLDLPLRRPAAEDLPPAAETGTPSRP